MEPIRPSSAGRRIHPRLEQLEPRQLLSGVPPTAVEQLFLERLNDARANPAAYGAAIGIDLSNIPASQPLAMDPRLVQSARGQSQDMNARGFFDHVNPSGVGPATRITRAGYPFNIWGESLAAGPDFVTPDDALKALIIDTGHPALEHRTHLLATDPELSTQAQAGVGIVQNGTGPLVNYYTIDTGVTTDTRPFLTGVVFNDLNANGKYDVGEGLGGVAIDVAGVGSVTTWASGGYSFQLSPGTYRVTAHGGALQGQVITTVTVGKANFRRNFTQGEASAQGSSPFISLLYQDLLGRKPGPSEIGIWATAIRNGATPAAVTAGFTTSAEYYRHEVIQWFQQYLRRTPDAPTVATLVSLMQQGTSEMTVLQGLLSSSEYFGLKGANAVDYVQGLFRDVLGRAPGPTEAAPWVSRVAAGDRLGAVGDLLASLEFKGVEVRGYFRRLLRRDADPVGLNVFVTELISGTPEHVVVGQITNSPEYVNFAHGVLWLRGLYQDLMGRAALDTPGDLGVWLRSLRVGLDRLSVARGFVASVEASNKAVNDLFQKLLGRAADRIGMQTFAPVLEKGGGVSDVTVGIASSTEYFNRQGANNTAFVKALYRDLLNRTGGSSEISFWVNRLNAGATRASVVKGFVQATEYQNLLLTAMFTRYLRRPITPAERTAYQNQLHAGVSDTAILAKLLASDDYYSLSMS
jgi:uncharacterized protein YkwD